MLENIDKEFLAAQFETDILMDLTNFSIEDWTLTLYFDVTYGEDSEILQQWKLECIDFQDHVLNGNYFEELLVSQKDPRLFNWNEPHVELYFTGTSTNTHALIGEMYLEHQRLSEGHVPFHQYTNSLGDLEVLIQSGNGLFATGPMSFIEIYEHCLSKYGLKTTILPLTIETDKHKFHLLEFGLGYVIAERFEAERLK